MSREVLSNRDYQFFDQGYLVDNAPWQDEIKKRNEEEQKRNLAKPWPLGEGTLPVQDFRFVTFETESLGTAVEVEPPPPTPEEMILKAKEEAREEAEKIEQAAKKNAFEIVEQSRWTASEIISKAKEDAEVEVSRLKEDAKLTGQKAGYEKGFEEGIEKGKLEGLESYSGLMRKWDGMVKQLVSERQKMYSDLQPVLIELVGEALHHCLRKEAENNDRMVVELAGEVLKKAHDRVELKLHINPLDLEEIKSQTANLQLTVGSGNIELVPDARVEKGGCLLETEAGSVDGRLETVVSQVKEAMASDLGQ
jgi:flagellar assembly protein FliH